MKYCEEYAALLDGFADGELPVDEMERVRAHLETCPGCRAYVDDIFAIRAGFPDAEDTIVPEGFAEGIMERVRADARRNRFRRWTGTLAALAACCALVVVLRSGLVGVGPGSFVSDTATVATAGAGEPEVYGMAGGAVENGAETRMAPEEPMETEDAVTEDEAAESQMMTMDRGEKASAEKKADSDYADLPVPAAAPENVDPLLLLCLSAEEAGDLLDGYTPVEETETERRYELSGEECAALLEVLGWERWENKALPETVVVEVLLSVE